MQEITLANLKDKSAQEVFNYVADHLLTQNQKATVDFNTHNCLYKNEEGFRCAAGCLIDPSEYLPKFEGHSWATLTKEKLVPEDHSKLISSLQRVHDSCPVEDWPKNIKEVAEQNNLSSKFIEEKFNDRNFDSIS